MSTSEQGTPSLKANTVWMFAGRSVRIGVQGVYFVLLARSLGVSQYGAFVGVAGLAGVFAPFASLGTGNLLIKNVSRDRSTFHHSWGETLTTTAMSGIVLSLLCIFVSHFAIPGRVSLAVIVPLVVAELIFARCIDIAGQAYMAFEKLKQTALLLLALSTSRMFAAAIMITAYKHPSASVWTNMYLISTIVPAICAIVAVNRQLGKPRFALSFHWRTSLEGLYFSICVSAQTIYNDIDKTMLASLAGFSPAGLYGAAYRILDVAGTPLGALLAASSSRFFQHGAKGLRFSVLVARKLMPKAILFAVILAATLAIAAPLLVPVLGHQYAEAATALRWLVPIVPLRCIHYLGADALSGGDRPGIRSFIQVTVAVVNVILNIRILPLYSWRGAVATSLACDALLAVLIWLAIWVLSSRDRITLETDLEKQPRPRRFRVAV